jgi:hypothetical protein
MHQNLTLANQKAALVIDQIVHLHHVLQRRVVMHRVLLLAKNLATRAHVQLEIALPALVATLHRVVHVALLKYDRNNTI